MKNWVEKIIEFCIYLSAYTVILALLLIFIFIGKEAIPIFTSAEVHQEVDIFRLIFPQESTGKPVFSWQPVATIPKYSLLPLFLGTLKVTVVALLVALPLALGAAIYTAEFAAGWLREIVKPIIEILAGIPSVVLGFFGLIVMASVLQNMFGWTYRLNAINAGIALGLAIIPVVYTIAEDALTSVPQSYREGSIALGSTPWQTVWRVVIPAATPGIFAAAVLGFGRAIGETMIVLMASGNAAIVSLDITSSVRSLSATVATELSEVVVGSAHYHVLFLIGILLFILTFMVNLFGNVYVSRLRKRLGGRR